MTFQPFTVQCPTCGSNLRVTDPAIVGTIAMCPQCQSMVQVERGGSESPTQIAVGPPAVDSQALTETGISSSALPNQGDSIGLAESTSDRPFAGQPTEKSDSAVEPPPQISAPPAWQSSRSKKHKQLALIAAVAASGILVSVMIFGWFVSTWQTRSTVSSRAPSSRDPSSAVAAQPIVSDEPWDAAPAEQSGNANSSPAGSASSSPAGRSVESQSGLPIAQDQPAATTNDESSHDQSTADSVVAENDPIANVGPVPPPAKRLADASIPTDLLPDSPLGQPDAKTGSEPSSVSAADSRSADTKTTDKPESDHIGMTELPPELAKYTDVLLKEGALDVPTIAAPPTIDDVELDGPAEDDDADLPVTQGDTLSGRTLNLRRSLGLDVAISTDGYPLADLILLISQFTAVPLHYDQPALEVAGIDVKQSMVVPKGMRSSRELIDLIAASVDCQWVPQPGPERPRFLLLTPTEQRLSSAIAELTSLDDFGPEQASAADFLKQFLAGNADPNRDDAEVAQKNRPEGGPEDRPDNRNDQAQPGAEDVAGDSPQLVAGQSIDQRVWAAIAMEALRRMRSIPSKRSERQLLQSISAVQSTDTSTVRLDWSALAGKEISVRTDTPVSVAGLVLRAARSAGATAIIDWPSVLRRGVGPETLLIPQPNATLDSVLSRWELPIRRIDDSHLWIGTDTAYDRQVLMVWTPTLGTRRAIVTERIDVIQVAHPDEDVRMVHDPISDRAMLKLPRYMARQMPKILGN